MPPMSQICPSLHGESMLPMFNHRFPYALVRRKFILSRSFLSYLVFACWPFPIQQLVHAHLVRLIYSKLSSIVEYLVLIDGGFLNALLPADFIPSNLDHLFWDWNLESFLSALRLAVISGRFSCYRQILGIHQCFLINGFSQVFDLKKFIHTC